MQHEALKRSVLPQHYTTSQPRRTRNITAVKVSELAFENKLRS